MTTFKTFLISKGISPRTAKRYHHFIERRFLSWLSENETNIKKFDQEQLMEYIRSRQQQNVKPKTINLEIKQISYYLEFKNLLNVAEPIRVKGITRRLPHGLLSEKQLDNMYHNFEKSKTAWTHENTFKIYHIILGLKVYQGLQELELTKLEISHLHLEQGQIYVPSTQRTNRRILDLKPFQVLPLHEYLLTERVNLTEEIEGNKLFHTGRLNRGMPRIKTMLNLSETTKRHAK
jgi:integrase/recombinase XerD